MAEYFGDICQKTGTFTKDGKEKAVYSKVGAMFASDKGFSIKLDLLPMPNEKGCWLTVFSAPPKKESTPKPPKEPSQGEFGNTDEIPF